MATVDNVQAAYLAIYRSSISQAQATATAAAIDAGTTTLDATISSYIANNVETTSPAIAILSYVDGVTPTSAKITDLATNFEVSQLASYKALGSSNPNLGPYEATGKAVADTDPNFAKIAAPTITDSDFITTNYIKIYGVAPTAAAAANFQSQITYFTNLYQVGAGVPAATAALEARGSTLGQMIGYAFTDPTASAQSNFDNQVAAFEVGIAKGTATYGTPLPVVAPPATVGVTIGPLTAGNDIVSTTQANTAFKSTANNDIINAGAAGNFNLGDTIDAGGGNDTLNATLAAGLVTTATTLVSVENVNITFTNGVALDLSLTTGVTSVGTVNDTAQGSIIGLAAGTALSVSNTVSTVANPMDDSGAIFALKDSSGSADVANLAVNNIHNAAGGGAPITLTGYETVNITASGIASTGTGGDHGIAITDVNLLALTTAGSSNIDIDLGGATAVTSIVGSGSGNVGLFNTPNTVTTIDYSAQTGGGVTDNNVGTGAVTIKGGAGVDTFANIQHTGAVVTLGAGNDTASFVLGTTGTASVTGGAGADTINLGGDQATSKVNIIYLAQTDSNNATFDTVNDFHTGKDTIDLTALHLGGSNVVTQINTATPLADGQAGLFTAGQQLSYNANSQLLLVDVDHNGIFNVGTDMVIKVVGLGGALAQAPHTGDVLI